MNFDNLTIEFHVSYILTMFSFKSDVIYYLINKLIFLYTILDHKI